MQTSDDKSSPNTNFDKDYLKWKSWRTDQFASLSKKDSAYFSAEIARTRNIFDKETKVLDIGFGNGNFLAYAKKQAWDVCGIEANQFLVETARENGFSAKHASDLSTFPDNSFDLIVAFDVLEHIPQIALPNFLNSVKRTLKDGGFFIARFPNGDSPFGLYYQNGDITHVTSIGSGKVQYFADQTNMELLFVGGEALPIFGIDFLHFMYRIIAKPIRLMIDIFVKAIIFPRARVAFSSPNMSIVFKANKSSQMKSSKCNLKKKPS